jgi:nucleotide-binding universal stress UspA family protein
MKRILVVVDGSVQASLALERAIEIARALPGSEILLLHIAPQLPPWQAHRPASGARRKVAERVAALAVARARAAGISARSRIEAGETADVVARIAHEEHADHIFLPEKGGTPVARAFLTLIGLSAHSAASRIIAQSEVPVTIVAHDREKLLPPEA